MKKLFFSLVVLVSTVTAQAAVDIHTDCRDHTFAYNKMQVTESETSINFKFHGATIFELFNRWEGDAMTEVEIDKSKCRLSSDRLLINCRGIKEVTVSRSNPLFGQPHDTDEVQKVVVKNLEIGIRFIESATSQRFELETQYNVEDSTDLTVNKVWFDGEREFGCHRR